jgi:hypothetical protein
MELVNHSENFMQAEISGTIQSLKTTTQPQP